MSRRVTRAAVHDSSHLTSSTSGANQHSSNPGMYTSSQFNHPAFNKLQLGSNSTKNYHGTSATSAVPKPPKAPEKPLMPYMRYSKIVWDEVKASQPELKLWEIGKIIGKMWRELASPEKQTIMDEYDIEKVAYQESLKNYHNSSAYQNYLQAKGRAEMNETNEMEREDSYLSIEADEGDTDDGFSVKYVSAARFQRNQRLMQEILSDCNVVQSGRSVVTTKRLGTLGHQVISLQHHHGKLKSELVDLEKKHLSTKRKWSDVTKKFEGEVKRLKAMSLEDYKLEIKQKQQKKVDEAAAAAAAYAASATSIAVETLNGEKSEIKANAEVADSKKDESNRKEKTNKSDTGKVENVESDREKIDKQVQEKSAKEPAEEEQPKKTTVKSDDKKVDSDTKPKA